MGTGRRCEPGFGAFCQRSALGLMALPPLMLAQPAQASEARIGAILPYRSPEQTHLPPQIPLHRAMIAPEGPCPETGFEFARSQLEGIAERPSDADRLLSFRHGFGLILNGGIRDVRKERITLGLHFARAF